MGKRGPKPKGKVEIKWSANFAYAIGLLASDGYVSKDGGHISFTSKDLKLTEKYKRALDISCIIGKKGRGGGQEKKYFLVQFSDVRFHALLLSVGLMPKKSKILGKVLLPSKYFFDFLRGSFDGDGSFYSYWDPRWRSSFMYYLVFTSASKDHSTWLRQELFRRLGVSGHITGHAQKEIYNLKYGKKESWKIIKKMYNDPVAIFLKRKWQKIKKALKEDGVLDKIMPRWGNW